MATRTWQSSGSTDMNLSSNYSGSGPLLSSDDLVFNNTSIVNATASANLDVGSITVTSGYTGNMSFAGYTATYETGNASFAGTGTLNLGNGLTMNGASGVLTVNSTVGTITATSCVLTFNGTNNFSTINKANTFLSVILGGSGHVTHNGTAALQFQGNSTLLTMGNNSTLTISGPTNFFPTGSMTLWSLGAGYSIVGTASYLQIIPTSTSPLTITIPATTITGSLPGFISLSGTGGGVHIYNITGTLNFGTIELDVKFTTFNSNNNSVSCGKFSPGSGSYTGNFGSSAMSVTSYDGSVYNSGTDNFQTSTWTVSNSWTFGSNHTINPGTSLVTFTNTATITSNTKSFYAVTVNAAGKTITLADNTTIASAGSFTLTAGTISAGTTYIIFSGSASIILSASLSSRIQTKTAGSTITWNTGANAWTIPAYVVNDIGGSVGSLVLWRSSTPTTAYKVNFPASVTLSYTDLQDCNNAGTLAIADATCTNSLRNTNFTFYTSVLQSISPINISSLNQTVTVTIFSSEISITISNVPINLVAQINNPIFLSSFLDNLNPINLTLSNKAVDFQLSCALNNLGPVNISILNGNTNLYASVLENLNVLNLMFNVNGPITSIPFLMNNEAIELFFDVILPKIKTSLFSDYADGYNSMGDGTNMTSIWINKRSSSYNQERRLFNNVITEAYNMRGVTLDFYVTSYNTNYDPIFGEDNDRRFIRTFKFRGFYQLPKEEKLFSKFGIEGMDQFSIFVSKLHFADKSQNYIPRIGDILNSNYNNFFYEICDIKEESGQYLLSKQFIWEFIVKPFKDERIQTTAATSATGIQDYTNKSSDIFDVKIPVEIKNEEIKYVPKVLEKPSNDPFNGWN